MLVRQPKNFILPSSSNNNNNNKYDNKNIKAYAVWIQQNVDLNVKCLKHCLFHRTHGQQEKENRGQGFPYF